MAEVLDGRVLVVAPIGRDAELIAATLARVDIAVTACRSARALLDELPRGAAVVLVTEESLDDELLNDLVAVVKQQPAWSDLPVIVLTSADRVHEPSGLVRRMGELGNVTVLERPVRTMTLVSTAQSAMRARRRQYEVRDHLVERERAAAELRERAEHTERLNRAKDEFLAMLGHELRNPIGAIAGAIGVLEHAGARDGGGHGAFDVIDRQARHLGRLVDDLLDVSRVTTGRIVLDRQPLDLGKTVAGCVNGLNRTAPADRHRITVTTEPVWVQGDETRLEQVVTNLVVNAVKYTPEGGDIGVRVTAEHGDAVLRVCDTGIGIPEDLVPRVFDLFFQVDRAIERTTGGLGIGLTLVQRLVQLHGGSVAVSSGGAGRGSTFTVRLPAIAASAVAQARAVPKEGQDARLTILLVEDNADARDMLSQLLRLQGHEVHEAADGVAGAAEALRLKPDVAIVDLGLPGLDGHGVARLIRADPEGEAMALIALTGYGQPEDRRRAIEAGFDTHLVKPVDPQRLAAALVRRRGHAPAR